MGRELVGEHHAEALAGNGRELVRGAFVHATATWRDPADPRVALATRHAGRSRPSHRLGVGREIAARDGCSGRPTGARSTTETLVGSWLLYRLPPIMSPQSAAAGDQLQLAITVEPVAMVTGSALVTLRAREVLTDAMDR
jgi:hypothetical protein